MDCRPRPTETSQPLPATAYSCDEVELRQLRDRLVSAPPAIRHWLQAELAWHLRQRDTAEALRLADEAEHPAADGELPEKVRARFQLVRAEACCLHGELAAAEGHLASAEALAAAHADVAADVCLLRAWVALSRGRFEDATRKMHAAEEAAAAADGQRRPVATAMRLTTRLVTVDEAPDEAACEAVIGPMMRSDHGVVRMWAHQAWGMLHSVAHRWAQSIAHFEVLARIAPEVGQLRRAIVALTSIGYGYNAVLDHERWLDAARRSLALARRCGWDATTGEALESLASAFIELKRLDEARTTLDEALRLLAKMPHRSGYGWALLSSAQLMLLQGDAAGALAALDALVAPRPGWTGNYVRCVQAGRVDALLALGRLDEAEAANEAQLAELRCHGGGVLQARAWRAAGEIAYRGSLLPGADADAAARRAVQRFGEAQACAAAIEGFQHPPELYRSLGAAHARLGEWQPALAAARQAYALGRRTRERQTMSRLQAEAAQHATWRAGEEVRRMETVAVQAAEHEVALQRMRDTLQALVRLGHAVMAAPDRVAVLERLDRHLPAALPGATAQLHDAALAPPAPAWCAPVRHGELSFGALAVRLPDPGSDGERARVQAVVDNVAGFLAVALANVALAAQLGRAQHAMASSVRAEQEARAQAESTLQARGDFAARIGGHLLQPLAVLRRQLLAVQAQDDTSTLRGALAHSLAVSNEASQLLVLVRLETGDVRPVPEAFALEDLLQDALMKLQPLVQAQQLQLRLACGIDVTPVWADIAMVDHALDGLLRHAFVVAPRSGAVAVGVCAEGGFVGLRLSIERPAAVAGDSLAPRIAREVVRLHGGRLDEFANPQVLEWRLLLPAMAA